MGGARSLRPSRTKSVTNSVSEKENKERCVRASKDILIGNFGKRN
jgi:hypothetical protein